MRTERIITKPVQCYGKWVVANEPMDILRRAQCLCFNCGVLYTKPCLAASRLLAVCKEFNLAVMVTRCIDFEHKPTATEEQDDESHD